MRSCRVGLIHRLPEEVSGKIAAGEVIEGPFSVVRELVDNALDAGASHVGVWAQNGGRDLLQVTDDGEGMIHDDALLSVEKHTTSKIRDIEDLNGLATIGFRGEALSSICGVSDFTMLTKRAGEEWGTKVRAAFGGEPSAEPAAANRGTEITVRDLFKNLPARRKFLKPERAENARIKDEVLKKALSFWDRGFLLRFDERMVIGAAPQPDPLSRIGEIFGSVLERSLVPIEHGEEHFSIKGFVSGRAATLSNRTGQYLFVNGRPVEDRSLLFAVNSPARGIVPAGRFVHAFVFIEIDPTLIDINVHPAKREMRIAIERSVHGALHRCVSRALEERFYGVRTPYDRETPAGEVTAVREPPPPEGSARPGETYLEIPGRKTRGEAFTPIPPGVPSGTTRGFFLEIPLELPRADALSFKGTLFGTYCLFEGEEVLLLVDQHAAHERVLYERYKESAQTDTPIKGLLVPINLTPPRSRYGEILENREAFRQAGFEIEPFGDDSINVLSVPAFVPEDFEGEAVSRMIDEFCEEAALPADPTSFRERFLVLAACRSAVKENDTLGETEALQLLADLGKTRVPFVCPHGRPTCFLTGRESFEKLFGRR
jgi:DNA mismatch repair protein MutL